MPHAFEKLSYSLLEGITPEADADFCQSLSAELGIQSAQIGKLMTFEVLEARMADQLPDPTPTSVTPAAGAPVAPPIGAGHS